MAITRLSPYVVRDAFTQWQTSLPLGKWAAEQGWKKGYTAVSDFIPGHDAEAAFTKGFKDAGGEIIGAVRFSPASPDFSPGTRSWVETMLMPISLTRWSLTDGADQVLRRDNRPAARYCPPVPRKRMEACHGMTSRSRTSTSTKSTIAMTEITTRIANTRAVSMLPLAEVNK